MRVSKQGGSILFQWTWLGLREWCNLLNDAERGTGLCVRMRGHAAVTAPCPRKVVENEELICIGTVAMRG